MFQPADSSFDEQTLAMLKSVNPINHDGDGHDVMMVAIQYTYYGHDGEDDFVCQFWSHNGLQRSGSVTKQPEMGSNMQIKDVDENNWQKETRGDMVTWGEKMSMRRNRSLEKGGDNVTQGEKEMMMLVKEDEKSEEE